MYGPYQPKSYIVRPSGTVGFGNTITFPDFPLSDTVIRTELVFEATVGTVATTPNILGVSSLIDSVMMKTTGGLNPGTIVNNVSGFGLRAMFQSKGGQLPRTVGSLASTGYLRVNIPVDHQENALSDNLRFITSLVPDALSGVTYQVRFAALSTVDAASALVLTGLNCYLIVYVAEQSTVPRNLATVLQQYEEFDYFVSTTGTQNIYIAADGHLGVINLTAFSGANTLEADGGGTPFVAGSGALLQLNDLARNLKMDETFESLRDWNNNAYVDTPPTGVASFLFNRGLNQFWDVQNTSTASQQVAIKAALATAAGAKVRVGLQRLLGLDPFIQGIYYRGN